RRLNTAATSASSSTRRWPLESSKRRRGLKSSTRPVTAPSIPATPAVTRSPSSAALTARLSLAGELSEVPHREEHRQHEERHDRAQARDQDRLEGLGHPPHLEIHFLLVHA